jgi:hypothetical protein
MKTIFLAAWCVLALAGCQSTRLEPKTGTELTTDGSGRSTLTTYVSEEEYQRMTPDERERLHAAVGASATQTLARWGSNDAAQPSAPLGAAELNKALAADAAQRASGQK